jgi:hypothetical protein
MQSISNASKLMHKRMQSISKCKQAIRYKHKQANASKQTGKSKQMMKASMCMRCKQGNTSQWVRQQANK